MADLQSSLSDIEAAIADQAISGVNSFSQGDLTTQLQYPEKRLDLLERLEKRAAMNASGSRMTVGVMPEL